MNTTCRIILVLFLSALSEAASGTPKHILFLAGQPSHGWDTHSHHAGCELLAEALTSSGLNIKTSIIYDIWPGEKDAFDNVDAIVLYCDGEANHMALGHEEDLIKISLRGTGTVFLHYAVAANDIALQSALHETIGGYYEKYWSVNPIWTVENVQLADHPTTQGVKPFSIRDEWYFHMRFRKDMHNVTPVLSAVPPKSSVKAENSPHKGNPTVHKAVQEGISQHLAWTSVNKSGSRGFGFTGGHFHSNWANDNFRKLVLNGIAWTAGIEMPENGIESKTPLITVNQSIIHAIAKSDIEDMKRHIAAGVNLNDQNQAGWTPLHYAAVRGNVEAARLLIQNGARVDIGTETAKTVLHFAADKNFMKLSNLLLEHGASVQALDNEGWTPLHYAAQKSHVETAELLISKGAPVNMKSIRGGTPLHEASASAKPEMIQLLMNHGADRNIKAHNGKTALDYAIELGNKEAEKILSGH